LDENKTICDDVNNAISYFKNTIDIITDYSEYNVGATFIGIKTNISGIFKTHIYVLLFPFIKFDSVVPYTKKLPNIFIKDVILDVNKTFYLWMYNKLKTHNSIIILTLDDNCFKVFNGFSDIILNIDKICDEEKEWNNSSYIEWYKKSKFNNEFTITLKNPYLYNVPFPVEPITIKTSHTHCNFIKIL
jgi:hypothetical protein